jgi:hypothetical protein
MCASPSPTPSAVKDPQSIERHVPNERNFQDHVLKFDHGKDSPHLLSNVFVSGRG